MNGKKYIDTGFLNSVSLLVKARHYNRFKNEHCAMAYFIDCIPTLELSHLNTWKCYIHIYLKACSFFFFFYPELITYLLMASLLDKGRHRWIGTPQYSKRGAYYPHCPKILGYIKPKYQANYLFDK